MTPKRSQKGSKRSPGVAWLAVWGPRWVSSLFLIFFDAILGSFGGFGAPLRPNLAPNDGPRAPKWTPKSIQNRCQNQCKNRSRKSNEQYNEIDQQMMRKLKKNRCPNRLERKKRFYKKCCFSVEKPHILRIRGSKTLSKIHPKSFRNSSSKT